MDANGRNRRDVGGVLDQRQGLGQWAPEGDAIYFPAERRGSLHLMRIAVAASISTSTPDRVVGGRGTVTGWSIARGGLVAYAMATPYDMGELFLQRGNTQPEKLTDLNRDLLAAKKIAEVESFTSISNDNKYEVEAFLTIPPGVPREAADMADMPKHPLIVSLHGGPHAQSGPAFTLKNQIYASRGWAVLHVNFRGSAGYGQAFQDAVIGEQNGDEAQDVLYGVSAAVRRYLWLDRERMGRKAPATADSSPCGCSPRRMSSKPLYPPREFRTLSVGTTLPTPIHLRQCSGDSFRIRGIRWIFSGSTRRSATSHTCTRPP